MADEIVMTAGQLAEYAYAAGLAGKGWGDAWQHEMRGHHGRWVGGGGGDDDGSPHAATGADAEFLHSAMDATRRHLDAGDDDPHAATGADRDFLHSAQDSARDLFHEDEPGHARSYAEITGHEAPPYADSR